MKKMLLLLLFSVSLTTFSQNLPRGFVYLSDIDKTIQSDLRYFSSNNFIGKPIDGYKNNVVIVTKETAKALKLVQKNYLNKDIV